MVRMRKQIKISETTYDTLAKLAWELYNVNKDSFKAKPNLKCATFDDAVSYLLVIASEHDTAKARKEFVKTVASREDSV